MKKPSLIIVVSLLAMGLLSGCLRKAKILANDEVDPKIAAEVEEVTNTFFEYVIDDDRAAINEMFTENLVKEQKVLLEVMLPTLQDDLFYAEEELLNHYYIHGGKLNQNVTLPRSDNHGCYMYTVPIKAKEMVFRQYEFHNQEASNYYCFGFAKDESGSWKICCAYVGTHRFYKVLGDAHFATFKKKFDNQDLVNAHIYGTICDVLMNNIGNHRHAQEAADFERMWAELKGKFSSKYGNPMHTGKTGGPYVTDIQAMPSEMGPSVAIVYQTFIDLDDSLSLKAQVDGLRDNIESILPHIKEEKYALHYFAFKDHDAKDDMVFVHSDTLSRFSLIQ